MANCACCNGELSASFIVDELCPECTEAMEAGLDPALARSTEPIPIGFTSLGQPVYIATDPDPIEPASSIPAMFPATRTLILINVCMYTVCVVLGLLDMQKLVDMKKLVEWGVEWGPATLAGQWWRIFSAMFLHAGLVHLLGNMLWLRVVGKMTEQIFSTWTFLSLYFLTGLAGQLLSLSVHPETHSVGASGAVFGITGVAIAALGLGRKSPSLLALSWRIWPLMIFTGLSLYGGATNPRIDNAAHLGGLVSGLFLGILLRGRFDQSDTERIKRFERRAFAGMGVFLVVGAISLRLHYSDILPLQTAQQALEAGRLEEAARIARAVTEKRPADVQAFLFLGEIYVRAGDYSHAVDSIDYALKLDPDNRDAARLRRDAARLRR
jgi:membrane associated rhomboid family serine protease